METYVWFNSVERLAGIGLAAIAIYVSIVLMVRVSGKRTTSQMNNFDWVITVAIGGLVASGIVHKDVSVADTLFAIAVLMVLQWITTTFVLRSAVVRKVVKADPTVLMKDGEFLIRAMKRERVDKAEIKAALREHGITRLDDTAWVVLETDGSFSVISQSEVTRAGVGDVLKGLQNADDRLE